jgi:hypothetical protein
VAEPSGHFQPLRSTTRGGEQRRTQEPPPIYVTGVQNISPMIQLLEQTAKEQYGIEALPDNHIEFQSKTSACYDTNVKSLAQRCTEFHNYTLTEGRSYRVMLKICTASSTPTISKSKLRN